MDALTQKHLLALNRQFYQTFGEAFAEKRGRLQPGVARLLPRIPPQARVLDLGCGHGMVLRALARSGFRGEYVGMDFSTPLLEEARRHAPAGPKSRFVQADLAEPGWIRGVLSLFPPALAALQGRPGIVDPSITPLNPPSSPLTKGGRGGEGRVPGLSAVEGQARPRGELGRSAEASSKLRGMEPFDFVLAFAVFHHLPGQALRQRVLTQAAALLRPGGVLMLSVWAFLHSPRLRQRVQPWERVGLRPSQVDPGDYLLDWRHGGQGLRYVHYFTPAELEALLRRTGLNLEEMFLSDGENGRLGLYAVGHKPAF